MPRRPGLKIEKATARVALERVEIIAQAMAAGTWVAGSSSLHYAREWGISREMLSRYSSEAARFLLLTQGDLATDVARLLASLDEVRKRAIEDGDYNAAVAATNTYLKARGAYTIKIDVTTPQLTRKQVVVELERALEELKNTIDTEGDAQCLSLPEATES